MPRYIIGIDEVGRGAIAGPVVVAAVLAPASKRIPAVLEGVKLRDSKRLKASEREFWFDWLKKQMADKVFAGAEARVYPKVIDIKNISRSANQAAWRALERVVQPLIRRSGSDLVEITVYLDGSLYLRSLKYQRLLQASSPMILSGGSVKKQKKCYLRIRTITGGDERIKIIKLASIFAKVSRDRYMVRQSRRYPVYGFHRHKGYGTDEHWQALEKYGPEKIHRLTFIQKHHKIKIVSSLSSIPF